MRTFLSASTEALGPLEFLFLFFLARSCIAGGGKPLSSVWLPGCFPPFSCLPLIFPFPPNSFRWFLVFFQCRWIYTTASCSFLDKEGGICDLPSCSRCPLYGDFARRTGNRVAFPSGGANFSALFFHRHGFPRHSFRRLIPQLAF